MGFVSNSSSSSTIIAVLPSAIDEWERRMDSTISHFSSGDTDYEEKSPAAIIEELCRRQAEGWAENNLKVAEKLKEVIVDVSNAGYKLFKCGFGNHGGMLNDNFPEIPYYPEYGGELGISPILCLDHDPE
jgi:hypothetical protein